MYTQPESNQYFVFKSFCVEDFLNILEILIKFFSFFVVNMLESLIFNIEQLQPIFINNQVRTQEHLYCQHSVYRRTLYLGQLVVNFPLCSLPSAFMNLIYPKPCLSFILLSFVLRNYGWKHNRFQSPYPSSSDRCQNQTYINIYIFLIINT